MVSLLPVNHSRHHNGAILTRDDATSAGVLPDTSHAHLLEFNVASVVVASLSLISTCIAVALFVQMRRSFRHDLILSLILSDMLQTLWLLLLPAVELARGHQIPSSSPFCQISGFFLSLGIEMGDMTVLLIALHTGMYIFRGRSGLYPYRIQAFTLAITGSFLLTSLAFINNPGFVNSGPYCYLPASPEWTIRALSWVPRYTVCVIILLTYVYIYIYVKGIEVQLEEPGGFQKLGEGIFSLGTAPKDATQSPTTELSRPNTTHHNTGCACLGCAKGDWPRIQPPLNIKVRLKGDFREEETMTKMVLSAKALNGTGIPTSRKRNRRQLRQLFIYPVVYVLGWIIPFIAHMANADLTGSPFSLVLASLISICMHGMADSLVFMFLEKPWRHPRRLICLAPLRRCPTARNSSTRVGRSREEMLVDGKLARNRRDKEEEDQRREGRGLEPRPREAKQREWWDVTLAVIDESGGEEAKQAV